MPDQRFVSSHLPTPRREHFRRQRELAVSSFGTGTRVLATREAGYPAGAVVSMSPAGCSPADSGFLMVAGSLTHRLKIGSNTIGREHDNDIIVADDNLYVSRRHCSIVVHTSGQAEIFDLASLNGTFVNGRRLEDREALRSHDVIRLGRDLRFTVVLYNTMGN